MQYNTLVWEKFFIHWKNVLLFAALALAMGRDNVSGGVAHLAVISEKGVEHVVIPGDKLPKFNDK